MATALTPHTCRDCGVTIPDGRGWFVWPGFPADGSAPLGVVWIEDEPEEDEEEGDFPPAGAIALCNACLLIRCPDFGILTDEDDEEEPSDAEVAAAWDRLLPESAVALQRYADGLVANVVAEHPQRDVYLSVRGIPDRFADALIAAGAAQQIAVEVCRDPGCDAPRGHIDIYRLDTKRVPS